RSEPPAVISMLSSSVSFGVGSRKFISKVGAGDSIFTLLLLTLLGYGGGFFHRTLASDLVPFGGIAFGESFDNRRIELCVTQLEDFLERILVGTAFPIATIGFVCEGGVDHREDPGADVNFF